MKTLKERIDIETAYDNGKKLDFRMLNACTETWYPLPENEDDIIFQWDMNDYRIKPEPMEFWINVYEPNTVMCYGLHETKNSAASHKSPDCIKTIKVREVLDER